MHGASDYASADFRSAIPESHAAISESNTKTQKIEAQNRDSMSKCSLDTRTDLIRKPKIRESPAIPLSTAQT
eukprot:3797154-Rhodomonas_salina.1